MTTVAQWDATKRAMEAHSGPTATPTTHDAINDAGAALWACVARIRGILSVSATPVGGSACG